ncbi:hypothetical protein DMENIID0001_039100 [Sergentomyia squamirostris]
MASFSSPARPYASNYVAPTTPESHEQNIQRDYPAGSLYGESIGFTMENLAVFMEILNENFMEKTMESVKQVSAISPCISPWISLWRYRYILASYGEN